ncbi:glycine--tRNA ligase subunit beta [Mangrovicoccus algicola]|uniref:Glycine--tRNA ligase beta subunit n=1 Tax=Mangrovicoccus algicola TaxID=2771008 RepID=A0A8J6Z3N1_9RHOB|nr:glycine--tRNA ligase subunit beta [Mangrovicoccus algicola]MBE3636879.1 glycine--tRNA ligase subunit beta [Mangrovicoccus algicola]
MPDLLIELFSEEIPARMQTKAGEDLRTLVTNGLVEAGLTYAGAGAFATPRRLALTVQGLLAESPTLTEERKGPKVGAPEKAVEGFLRATGLTLDQLEIRDEKKGQVYYATFEKPGRKAAEIVAEVLAEAIQKFPWPKSMRWGTGDLRWVRPLHSILCILHDEAGHEIVPLEIGGIVSGDTTEGHRFMAPGRFRVGSFDDYAAALSRRHVVLDADDRASHIWADATNQAFACGLEVVEDHGLLVEVSGLVEWPVVLMGEIGETFLDLPPEVLKTSMKEHQKFFSVKDPATGRILRFVTVANRETRDGGAEILRGNQKVLSARLSDAKFFWENDLRVAKAGMGDWLDSLGQVTFHNKLGSQAGRIGRIAALACEIAPLLGADADQAETAARLAKADLSSEMVYEFPELQGVMGRYYIEAAGHPAEVAAVAAEHYQPLGPSDAVPSAPLSVAVALADKIDTLTGFWAIDEKPTGSKDPFALRRAALGVIRLLLENGVRCSLAEVFARANGAADAADLLSFFHDRLKVYLRDKGIPHDVIDACLAMPGADDIALLVKRAEALEGFLKTADGGNLVQGFKRANNILAQAEAADGVEYSFGPDVKLAETEEERALFAALEGEGRAISSAIEAEDFAAAMRGMAALRAPIDAFFEAVQVNSDNQVVRRNRLNLLHVIRTTCSQVADLGRLAGERGAPVL